MKSAGRSESRPGPRTLTIDSYQFAPFAVRIREPRGAVAVRIREPRRAVAGRIRRAQVAELFPGRRNYSRIRRESRAESAQVIAARGA